MTTRLDAIRSRLAAEKLNSYPAVYTCSESRHLTMAHDLAFLLDAVDTMRAALELVDFDCEDSRFELARGNVSEAESSMYRARERAREALAKFMKNEGAASNPPGDCL